MDRFLIGAVGSLLLLTAGCSHVDNPGAAPVRHVRTGSQDVSSGVLEQTRQILNDDFPRIGTVLATTGPKEKFCVHFKERVWLPRKGPTSGLTRLVRFKVAYGSKCLLSWERNWIELSAAWLQKRPEKLRAVLLHEMTHIYQNYAKGAPLHWREGIADYVAYAVLNEQCPQCTAGTPTYDAGYSCAAALFLYIEKEHEPAFVRRLHERLTEGGYTDCFFEEQTGKSLDQLWYDFQSTAAFTKEAKEVLAFRSALKAAANPARARELFYDFIRPFPGGRLTLEAIRFVQEEVAASRLPGPDSKGDHGNVEGEELKQPDTYPARRTIHFLSSDQSKRYDYFLSKPAENTSWRVDRILYLDNRTGAIKRRYNYSAPES